MTTIHQRARQMFGRAVARAGDEAVSLALVDLDRFREFNERHGVSAGDELVAAADATIRSTLGSQVVARIGGDEFGVLLAGQTPEEAFLAMEGVRQALATRRHPVAGHKRAIPVSIGIASFPHHVDDVAGLLRAADEALQRAKREGRNRVTLWTEEKMAMKANYYSRAQLGSLAGAARRLGRTEASILREALDDWLERHRDL